MTAAPAPAIILRDYQLETVTKVLEAEEQDRRRLLAVLPTGAGKTVIFSSVIKALGTSDGPALILAHRDELLNQAIDKLSVVWPDADVGKVRGSLNETDARDVVVASVATASRDNRLEQLAQRDWRTIIVDEAHHAPAASYTKVLNRLVGPRTLVLGVTATPTRYDGQAVGQVFDEVVSRVSIEELVDAGYLVDCRLVRVRLDMDLRDVTTSGGDYSAGDLGRRLASAGLAGQVARAYLKHGERRPAVAYVPTVDLAYETAAAMTSAGAPCGIVSGDTPTEERAATFRKLRTGELMAVANCMVLTEGWDEPCVSCVIVGRPTRSTSLYTQMVGRGLRPHPDKGDCLVIDVTGIDRDPSQAGLADLGGDGLLSKDQLEIARELIRLLDDGMSLSAAKRKAVETVGSPEDRAALRPSSGRQRDAFNWLRDDRSRYCLSLGKAGIFVLFPRNDVATSGKYAGVLLATGQAQYGKPAPVSEVIRDADLTWAQGVAEELVRRYSSAKVSSAQMAWRDESAGDGQVSYGRRLGLSDCESMTKGELADALTLAIVASRFDSEPTVYGERLTPKARENGAQAATVGTENAVGPENGASPAPAWWSDPATEPMLRFAEQLKIDLEAKRPEGGWTKRSLGLLIDEAKSRPKARR